MMAAAKADSSTVSMGQQGSSLQEVCSITQELQAAMDSGLLDDFFQGWDLEGGAACLSLRQQVCNLLQAATVSWQEVHFAAEALQELCWERLHTGHWMDVAVVWRDAYCLYSLLTVMASLAAHSSQHTPLPATAHPADAQHTSMQLAPAQGQQHVHSQGQGQQEEHGNERHQQTHTSGKQQAAAGAAAHSTAANRLRACSAWQPQPQLQLQLLLGGMKALDLAALMGGLRFRRWLDRLINALDSDVQQLQDGVSRSQVLPGTVAGSKRAADDVLSGSAADAALAAPTGACPGRGEHWQFEAAGAAEAGVVSEHEPAIKQPKLSAPLTGQHPPVAFSHQLGPTAQSPTAAGEGHTQAGVPAAAVPVAAEAAAGEQSSHGRQTGQDSREEREVRLPPGSLTPVSAVVPVEHAPSMEHFMVKFLLPPGGPQPVVLRGVMCSWPAMTRWKDLDYLRKVAGRRTVPVEVGSHYLAEGWGTQLMTLDEFITALMDTGVTGSSSSGPATAATCSTGPPPQQSVGGAHEPVPSPAPAQPQQLLYLAQHQLFEQIPALAADIMTPDYCLLGDKGVSSVNAWFGPAGTVTPLHQDPEHNCLAQVVGRKYVRLYVPEHTEQLYPHQSGMHTNTSRVDLDDVDDSLYPCFKQAPYTDVVLEPGDILYMPPKWWHYVKSLSVSFSVSFWWS